MFLLIVRSCSRPELSTHELACDFLAYLGETETLAFSIIHASLAIFFIHGLSPLVRNSNFLKSESMFTIFFVGISFRICLFHWTTIFAIFLLSRCMFIPFGWLGHCVENAQSFVWAVNLLNPF